MIWAILITTSFVSIFMAIVVGSNPHVAQAARRAAKETRTKTAHRSILVVNGAAALAIPTLWTVYAFQIGDWRFAAIALIGPVVNLMVRLATSSGAGVSR